MWDARGPPLTLSSVPALFGQFAFRDDVPLVRLEVADEWARPEQAVVRYRVETVFARSSWDWIGLYRVRRIRIWGEGSHSGGRKEPAGPLRHWCIQCLMLCGKLLVLGDHNPGSSFLRWVSVTVRIMWLMSGPSMKKWMGISTRYL